MRGPVRHRVAEAANAAAESRGTTGREFGRRVTLEPLSIVVATRSHLFADISCAGLLCGKANHATLPRRNRARRVSFRPVDVGRGIAVSVRSPVTTAHATERGVPQPGVR